MTLSSLNHTITGSLVPCQGGSAASSAAKAKLAIGHVESFVATLRGLCTDFDVKCHEKADCRDLLMMPPRAMMLPERLGFYPGDFQENSMIAGA